MDMNANMEAAVSMDDLLDGTLDDLKDVPAFKVYPPGAHAVKISWEFKDINNQKCPAIKLAYISPLELTNPEAVPPEAGDECEVAFLFKDKEGKRNEFAEGNFKAILQGLKPLAPNANTPREIMEATNGAEVAVVTDIRLKDKKDPQSQAYLVIKEVVVNT